MQNGALLRVNNISKSFAGVQALNGCSLDIETGSITGVIGPNGAGKTTLLSVISGALKLDSGSIVLGGENVTPLRPDQRATRGMIRTFQIARELENLTVFENLLLAGTSADDETLVASIFNRSAVRRRQTETADRANALLERAGLSHVAANLASDLSGGQKKLLELARALMMRPRLLLLDEPAAGVAPPLVESLMAFIQELSKSGITFGIIEHNMGLIETLCDRVHVLAEGTALVSGTFAEVTSDARVRNAYLGRAA